jgi:hypothetical protein
MFTLMFGELVSMSRQPEWAREMERRIVTRLERFTRMATQAEIDAIAAGVASLKSDVDTAATNLAADDSALATAIADLKTQNPAIDLTTVNQALSDAQASVQNLQSKVQDTANLVPAPGGGTGGGTTPPVGT